MRWSCHHADEDVFQSWLEKFEVHVGSIDTPDKIRSSVSSQHDLFANHVKTCADDLAELRIPWAGKIALVVGL